MTQDAGDTTAEALEAATQALVARAEQAEKDRDAAERAEAVLRGLNEQADADLAAEVARNRNLHAAKEAVIAALAAMTQAREVAVARVWMLESALRSAVALLDGEMGNWREHFHADACVIDAAHKATSSRETPEEMARYERIHIANLDELRDMLSGVLSYLGEGPGTPSMTPDEWGKALRHGFDTHIGVLGSLRAQAEARATAAEQSLAEVRGALEYIKPALPVLRTMLTVAGLTGGAEKADEMIAALAALNQPKPLIMPGSVEYIPAPRRTEVDAAVDRFQQATAALGRAARRTEEPR